MGTSPLHGPDEVRARMRAWEAEWSAVAGCTDPADRPRAEAAIAELYEASGNRRTAPRILWVGSPDAGALAYIVARHSRPGIISDFATGDVGTGDNREFRGLAEPFGMEPAWTRRLVTAALDRLPVERRAAATSHDPYLAAAQGLGLTTTRIWEPVRQTAGAAEPDLERGVVDGTSVDVLAGALGEAWTRVAAAIGDDLARELFLEAVRRLTESVVIGGRLRRDAAQAMQPGQWDMRTPILAATRDVFGGYLWRPREGRAAHERQVDLRLELARSAGPWWAVEGLAIVSERPLVIHRDDRGRPHGAHGPAIAWPDGTEVWAWHGVPIERRIVAEPDTITVGEIDRTSNLELRRVLVERFGEERLIREGGAKLLHEDATGRLWRRDLGPVWPPRVRDEPVVMVEVKNSTPEPDGSRRTYYLRVPPTMTTAHEAVAWTFALGAVAYRPQVET